MQTAWVAGLTECLLVHQPISEEKEKTMSSMWFVVAWLVAFFLTLGSLFLGVLEIALVGLLFSLGLGVFMPLDIEWYMRVAIYLATAVLVLIGLVLWVARKRTQNLPERDIVGVGVVVNIIDAEHQHIEVAYKGTVWQVREIEVNQQVMPITEFDGQTLQVQQEVLVLGYTEFNGVRIRIPT